jgi:cbb3-type cytochrome oxidase subunit 3
MTIEWIALYKLGRLALLAIVLTAITAWAFRPSRRERLEEPARRMLREDDR